MPPKKGPAKKKAKRKTPLPVPALVLSDALLFADPAADVLLTLDESNPTWRDAIVLAPQFWCQDPVKLNQPIDLGGVGASPLLVASIGFDPDRPVRLKNFIPAAVTNEMWRDLGAARNVHIDPAMKAVALKAVCQHLPHLTSIVVNRSQYLLDVSTIASLKHLQRLDLRFNETLTTIEPLQSLKSLVLLNLSQCQRVTDVSALGALTSLEKPCLSKLHFLTDIEPLATLTALQSLVMEECSWVKDITAVASMTSLVSLNVERCSSLETVPSLTPLSSLRCLRLSWCSDLDEKLSFLEPPLRSLEEIHFDECQSVTDASVLTMQPSLRRVSGWNCLNLDRSSVEGLTGLEYLELGIDEFRDEDFC